MVSMKNNQPNNHGVEIPADFGVLLLIPLRINTQILLNIPQTYAARSEVSLALGTDCSIPRCVRCEAPGEDNEYRNYCK